MFTTYVLFCSLITGSCTEAIDTRGPYDTQQQCVARAVEMAAEISQVAKEPQKFHYKCKLELGKYDYAA